MINGLTAIVIFANSPYEEGKRKQFSSNGYYDQVLLNRLNSRIVSNVRKTNRPYFIIDENLQKGVSFGEKISNTIQETFEKGYQNLIIVGNDTPGLNCRLLKKAIIQLESGSEVLGPDLRGGLYLIGIRKETFSSKAFKKFSWQTKLLFTDFINYYARYQVYILPKMKDLNSQSDAINSIFDVRLSYSIRKLLAFCLEKTFYFKKDFRIQLINIFLNEYTPLRAPPICN